MRNQIIVSSFLVMLIATVVGCSESKPEMVADPNAYAPYQASPEEIAAQQEQARQEASQPRK